MPVEAVMAVCAARAEIRDHLVDLAASVLAESTKHSAGYKAQAVHWGSFGKITVRASAFSPS